MPLLDILRTRVKMTRQGALTVGKRVCGDVLEGGEALVANQSPANRLRALCTDAVVVQTASESRKETSRGADTFVQKRARIMKNKEATHLSVLNFGANPDESKCAMTLASLAASDLLRQLS